MAVPWSMVADQEKESQAGVFIVRIWREPHSASGFRARIIESSDLRSPNEGMRAADTADEITAAVREWIDKFVAPDE